MNRWLGVKVGDWAGRALEVAVGGGLQLQLTQHLSSQSIPDVAREMASGALGLEDRTSGIGFGGELPAPEILIDRSVVYIFNAVTIDIAIHLLAR